MARNVTWADLSRAQRTAVLAGAAVEIVVTAWAAHDLWRRPAEEVRGPKALWAAALVVQPFGPLAYRRYGRR